MSLEGRLEDLGLPDIFQIISLSKRSGVLTIIRKEGSGRLVFNNGQVVYASADNKSRLGYSLVRKGVITQEDLENALREQKRMGGGKPLGTVLLEMKAISQEILEKEIRGHITDVVRELLSWPRGSFHFELGEVLCGDDVVMRVGVNTEFLLLEGARMQDEAGRSVPREEPGSRTISVEPDNEEFSMPAPASMAASPAVKTGAPQEKPRKDLNLLTSMIAELSGPSTDSEITLMILRFASEIMSRAVLFLAKKDEVVGLGQFGLVFEDENPNSRVRKIQVPLGEPSVFRDVVAKRYAICGPLSSSYWNNHLVEQLGGEKPPEAFVAPLISNGFVIGLLYGDNLPSKEPIGDTEGLEAFIKVAGFAFGKALLERRLQGSRAGGTA